MSKFTDVLIADILQTLVGVIVIGLGILLFYCFFNYTAITSTIVLSILIISWLLSVYDRSRNS